MRPRTPPLRVVGHALWLGVMLACAAPLALVVLGTVINTVGHHPDSGTALASVLWFAVVTSPAWLPVVVVLAGIVGVSAGGIVGGGSKAARLGAALLGLGVLAGLAAAGYQTSSRTIGWAIAPVAWAILTGLGAAALARRRNATDLRLSLAGRRAAWWGLGAGLAAVCTGTGAVALWIGTGMADGDNAVCASRLGVAQSQAVYAQTLFPPQAWCLSATAIKPWVPVWTGPALVGGLTATLLLGLAALRCLVDHSAGRLARRWTMPTAAALVFLGIVAAAVMADPQPPADAVARARLAGTTGSPSVRPSVTAAPPSPVPAPKTSLAPAVPAAAARDDLAQLQHLAQQAGGAGLLWPGQLALSEAACTNSSGTAGTQVTLTGRFTTRDLASAANNQDFLEITQANERVAKQIVDAWVASGLVGVPDQIHGEWYTGDAGRNTIKLAHVGFVEGAGDIRVTSQCATYA